MATNCLAFKGSTAKVAVDYNAALNISTNLTLELDWIPDNVTQNCGLLVKSPLSSDQGDYNLNSYNGRIYFRLNGSTSEGSGQCTSTTTLTAGELYRIRAVYDGSKQYIFVNGILDGEANYSTSITNHNYGIVLGNYYDGNYAQAGNLANVRISNSVRGTAQYVPTGVAYTNDANTVLLWKLNEGTGTSITDYSSNGLPGTVSGSTYEWTTYTWNSPASGKPSAATLATLANLTWGSWINDGSGNVTDVSGNS